jgi:DNA-directed RNA polymerase subunit RPC12/RpoP
MKLIKLTCPSCGAKLEINSSLKKFTCNYCGVTSLLDDEAIVIKNVHSKLQNYINELKEYYDNGNYNKCYELSKIYLIEYPDNEEIQYYYDESEAYYVVDYAVKILNKYKDLNYKSSSINKSELESDYKRIVEYSKIYDCEELEETKKVLSILRNNIEMYYKFIMVGVVIIVIFFLISACSH